MVTWKEFQNIAGKVAKEYNFPVSVILGQAALETGRDPYKAPQNNWFGIKGYGTAGTQNLTTQEAGSKGFYTTKSNFASYVKAEDSIRAYVELIKRRYPQAWNSRDDPVKMIKEIKKGGYATDPQYVAKVTGTPEFKEHLADSYNMGSAGVDINQPTSVGADIKNLLNTFFRQEETRPANISGKSASLFQDLIPTAHAAGEMAYSPVRKSTTTPSQTYKIQPGDTLSALAKSYNLNLSTLLAANPQVTNPNLIYSGRNLTIPTANVNYSQAPQVSPNIDYSRTSQNIPYTPKSSSYHIKSGDTLSQIAQKYNVNLNSLLAKNPQISNPNLIYAGNYLNL